MRGNVAGKAIRFHYRPETYHHDKLAAGSVRTPRTANPRVVPRLTCAVSAGIRAPLAPAVVLEEHQDAPRRSAGAQVVALRSGQQGNRVGSERAQDDLAATSRAKVNRARGLAAARPAE